MRLSPRTITAIGFAVVALSYLLPWEAYGDGQLSWLAPEVGVTGIASVRLAYSGADVLLLLGPIAGTLVALVATGVRVETWKIAWPALLVALFTWGLTVARLLDTPMGLGLPTCFGGLVVAAVGVVRRSRTTSPAPEASRDPTQETQGPATARSTVDSVRSNLAVVVAVLIVGGWTFWVASKIITDLVSARDRETAASPTEDGAAPAQRPAFLIEDGVGIKGKLALCDPAGRIVDAFGEPTVVDAGESPWYGQVDDYVYKDSLEPLDFGYLNVTVRKSSDSVIKIVVRSPWRTTRGLRQGDTDFDMRRIYGEPVEDWNGFSGTTFEYRELGLTFYQGYETRRMTDQQGLPRDGHLLTMVVISNERQGHRGEDVCSTQPGRDTAGAPREQHQED